MATLTALLPLLVYLASGALNWALAFKSPDEWATYAAHNPSGASARKLLRKIGLDAPGIVRLLPGLLRAAQTALGARAALPKRADGAEAK